MSTKVTPLDANKRSMREVLENVKALLQEHDENSIQGIYVRLTYAPDKDGRTATELHQSGLYWEDLAMMEVELRRMLDSYYDECNDFEE